MIKNFFLFIWDLVKIAAIAFVIIMPIRYFLIQPFYVRGASMEPNFHDHEYLIVDELSYRMREPKRGEIVVFRYPRNPQEYFIKRLIGLPGEKIEIKDGQVVIYNDVYKDGVVLEEEYLPEGTMTRAGSMKNVVSLSDNEYFLMGDNRNSSKDSRSFGPVNESFITGKVFFRGWPIDKMKIFKDFEYKF